MQLTLLAELLHHVQAEYVRLSFFEAAGSLFHRFTNGACAVYRVLDTESVPNLMEHGVLEEGVEVEHRDRLGARVCLYGVENGVVCIQIRVGARRLALVLGGNRNSALQFRRH